MFIHDFRKGAVVPLREGKVGRVSRALRYESESEKGEVTMWELAGIEEAALILAVVAEALEQSVVPDGRDDLMASSEGTDLTRSFTSWAGETYISTFSWRIAPWLFAHVRRS